MENAGIDLQVIGSSNPGCELFPTKMSVRLAKINNDHLAAWIAKYADKFVVLGSLPMQDSNAALEEFDRIRQLGFKGLILFSNIRKKFVDYEEFWPIYSRAEKYSFPIFLHPGTPIHAEAYSEYNLWGPVFGFGVDCAHAALRLIMSGIFEHYPKLRIVLGHLGETIPFFLRRMDKTYQRDPELLPKIKKRPSEYFLDNFYVDTAAVGSEASLMCAYDCLAHGRILFGSDYPFEDASKELQFVKDSPIPVKDKTLICSKNAAELLQLS